MILLWGMDGDGPMDAVRHALDSAGASYCFANQRYAGHLRVQLGIHRGGHPTGQLTLGRRRIALEDIHAFYLRPYATKAVSKAVTRAQAQLVQMADAQLSVFADLCPGCVLNRPQAMASNQSKPYQLNIIRQHGFDVPTTLITTDPDAAHHFWEQHGDVIYKSISGTRSIVRRLQRGEVARLASVAHAPTQFQEYVPGRDIRVHVIGTVCYATAIDSDADDYRYAQRQGDATELFTVELPDKIVKQCVHVSQTLGLPLSGIDLRHSPDGRWFCFEVNPSPAFTYYEESTGQPLAAAVAQLLRLSQVERRA
jgi:hypothetical protein